MVDFSFAAYIDASVMNTHMLCQSVSECMRVCAAFLSRFAPVTPLFQSSCPPLLVRPEQSIPFLNCFPSLSIRSSRSILPLTNTATINYWPNVKISLTIQPTKAGLNRPLNRKLDTYRIEGNVFTSCVLCLSEYVDMRLRPSYSFGYPTLLYRLVVSPITRARAAVTSLGAMVVCLYLNKISTQTVSGIRPLMVSVTNRLTRLAHMCTGSQTKRDSC